MGKKTSKVVTLIFAQALRKKDVDHFGEAIAPSFLRNRERRGCQGHGAKDHPTVDFAAAMAAS